MKAIFDKGLRAPLKWKSKWPEFNPAPRPILLTCYFLILTISTWAQSDIPIGTWRIHSSFNTINSVAIGNQKIFGAAHTGIMVLDQNDNSISSHSKLSGLSGTAITFISYDASKDLLLVTYENGKFDVIKSGNEILNFDPTKNTAITGSKKINHILLRNTLAYLSSDYGVIVFDLTSLEIKETWRDLGSTGATLKIQQGTFSGDSIFLATERGVLAGDINTNLLDFNNWKRFDAGEFYGPVQSISTLNTTVYVAINNSGLHRYGNGSWIKTDFLQGSSFQSINASVNTLFIAQPDKLWKLSMDDVLTEVIGEGIEEPLFATEDSTGKLWVGDGQNGLVSNVSGSFTSYLPNSPSNKETFNLKYYNGTIYALSGGYSSGGIALDNSGNVDLFLNGVWSTENLPVLDVTDLAFDQGPTEIYCSSFGYGVANKNDQGVINIFDESNSPLVNSNPPGRFVNITSLVKSKDGLWVANYGAAQSLHLLKEDNTWESFTFPITASRYPLQLATDFYGSVWAVLNPDQGGGILVFNKEENTTAYLTDATASGGLPSKSVRSIAVDRDGLVWVGTDQGIAYFMNPSDVFSPDIDAIKPIFENRFLLKDDKITAISVDGGNRKWIGTERGVWLFNPTGEELIYNFTAENSPLISNVIRDIEINAETGEVFFATDIGLTSFRADATESNTSFQTVKVFPNPVTSNFAGTVGISGLATDAIIKITDVGGKLIWQTQANGGTASWNVQDYRGRRAPTGIYIIFAVTQDGSESIVAKIAVVE